MAIDPYRTLGLEPGATAAEVKRAYRRLAKANHPDSAGPAALPRFLAIQEAYEALTTGLKPGRGRATAGGARTGGGPGAGAAAAGEPWRADPARARAAREQARARGRSGAGPGSAGPGSAGGGSSANAGTRGRASGTADPRGPGSRPAGGTPRKRAPRKATMGSTSYDEARDSTDPNDTTWAGASWYGPTSGEYWRVNPREYADPRKHGPQYQSRGRRASTTTGEAWDAGPGEPDGNEPAAGEFAGAASGATDEATAAERTSDRAWAPPSRKATSRATGDQDDRDATFAETLAALGRRLDREPNDPIRRLGYALVAWAPVGLAVAAVVGGATGCTTYGASCTGAAPMIPWLLQAAILGLLLLLPRLARILATGSVAVVLALVPLTFVIIAIGGSGEPSARGLLQTLLAIVWVGGVGLGVWAAMRVRGARSPTS